MTLMPVIAQFLAFPRKHVSFPQEQTGNNRRDTILFMIPLPRKKPGFSLCEPKRLFYHLASWEMRSATEGSNQMM